MQKPHVYEAILLVNRGIDDAVRGLERLKRAQDWGLNSAHPNEKLTLFEAWRVSLNICFRNNVEGSERRDKARFAKRHLEHETRMLDEVQVDQDVRAIEESRHVEGVAPMVRFLSTEERRSLERQFPKSSGDITGEIPGREGDQR
jgi:hypothetical protein